MELDLNGAIRLLQGDAQLCEDELRLDLEGCVLRLRSNSPELVARLRKYFAHVAGAAGDPTIDVIAIEREPVESGLPFKDWKREPGKTGRKDAYFDFPGGRLVLKVRTGMLFLQSGSARIAAGPCLQYDNQVINFINAQYMNWLQNREWLICHAAGMVHNGRGFGIAGFSGGGKSTLMLHLMDHAEVKYLTNDRLFVKRIDSQIIARGIPKLPRVNPGTIVHNPALHSLIPPAQREALLQLPAEKLWELEEKYDVDVEQTYGKGRIVQEAPLSAFLVLNWQRDGSDPLAVNPVDLGPRRELLGAIMKSPGPFYQYPDGSFYQDDTPFDEEAYLDIFQDITVYEVTGRVDFEGLTRFCLERLLS
ncbi:MAG TPA: HprK-related kinase B [Sedimenticola sp.]|nr:HprK-related kinase B [Sedimenticola sp.]